MPIVNSDDESGDASPGLVTFDDHDPTGEDKEIDEEKAEEIRRKAKARKSGPSLLRKAKELGIKADIFALTMYFDPTHKNYAIQINNPEGAELPDVNQMIKEKLLENAGPEHKKSRPYTRSYAEKSVREARRPSRKPGRPLRKRGRPPRNFYQQENMEETTDGASADGRSESGTAIIKNCLPSSLITVPTVAQQQKSNTELEQSNGPNNSRASNTTEPLDEERAWELLNDNDFPGITGGEDTLSWLQPDSNISEEGKSPLSGASLCSESSSLPTIPTELKPASPANKIKGRYLNRTTYERLVRITNYPVMRADNSAPSRRPQQHRRVLPDRRTPGYRSGKLNKLKDIISRTDSKDSKYCNYTSS